MSFDRRDYDLYFDSLKVHIDNFIQEIYVFNFARNLDVQMMKV